MNQQSGYETPAPGQELSTLVIHLLKGVIYRDETSARNAGLWHDLLELQARVRDYVAILGLELVLDEAEGYAFLRSQVRDAEEDTKLPRLVARRPLSFPVSLLLALLRKKLAEFDAGGEAGTRLVLTRNDIVELLRVFMPETSNEARLMDRVEAHLNKVVELGFLRRMKPTSGQPPTYEVRRILKAFVDAQWLTDFDARLAAYRNQLETPEDSDNDD
jgi:hypothetical protein